MPPGNKIRKKRADAGRKNSALFPSRSRRVSLAGFVVLSCGNLLCGSGANGTWRSEDNRDTCRISHVYHYILNYVCACAGRKSFGV